jgi:hypothetical protein
MGNTAWCFWSVILLDYETQTSIIYEEKVLLNNVVLQHVVQASDVMDIHILFHEDIVNIYITCLEGRVVAQVAECVPGSSHVSVHDFLLIPIQTCGCVQVETLHPGLESTATNTSFGYGICKMHTSDFHRIKRFSYYF